VTVETSLILEAGGRKLCTNLNGQVEIDMIIGERLRGIREHKNLSQGDIEKRTGLLRCYISRVENGHTVPAVETLEKLAQAFEIPLYQLFYDGDKLPNPLAHVGQTASEAALWESHGKSARFIRKLRQNLSRIDEADRELLMFAVQRMAQRGHRKSS
jgi:transcriptional regulator with XRE-family HTH domain